MKTIKQVIEENKEFKTLIKAVVSRIGKESIEDVNNHGIANGFSGFIYYTDTHKFAMYYRRHIIRLLGYEASCLGEELVSMVLDFNQFTRNGMEPEDKQDLYKYLGGGRPSQGTITNLMAWYAAETVCRMFED